MQLLSHEPAELCSHSTRCCSERTITCAMALPGTKNMDQSSRRNAQRRSHALTLPRRARRVLCSPCCLTRSSSPSGSSARLAAPHVPAALLVPLLALLPRTFQQPFWFLCSPCCLTRSSSPSGSSARPAASHVPAALLVPLLALLPHTFQQPFWFLCLPCCPTRSSSPSGSSARLAASHVPAALLVPLLALLPHTFQQPFWFHHLIRGVP